MIKPIEMTKVRIISPSSQVRHVIETLYDMKLLHIVDFHKGEEEFFDIGKPFKEAAIYSEQLVDIRAVLYRLAISGAHRRMKNFHNAQKLFLEVNKKFKVIVSRLDKLKADENRLLEELKNPLIDLNISKDDIKDYKNLVVFTGTVKSPIESKLSAITKDYILTQAKIEKQFAFVLYAKKGLAEKVKSVLSESGFAEYEPPILKQIDIGKNLSDIKNEISNLETQLESFKKEDSQFLLDYEHALTQLNEKAEAPLKFASSKSTLIASGWIPSKAAESLRQNLSDTAKEKVSVEFLHGENPPTALENPKIANKFEFFLNLYSLPKYYEIDPTILMFITFPLFFGFMLGDVGYGLITLMIMLLLERMLPVDAKPLLRIVAISSLASIAFGFVFGEFFGREFTTPLINRVHDINTMMMITIAVGIAHVNFGFILGLINELKHHNFLTAFFRKGSWITLQIGAALLGFGYMQANQSLQAIGGLVAIGSVLMIINGEGILRIIELPTLLSNILSYFRLYAIGLASVSFAVITNDLAAGFFSQGGFSLIIGVSILFLGHAMNLMLGLIGPFLHSLRLHYVEFFQKFYEGGGYRYSPFGIVKTLGGR